MIEEIDEEGTGTVTRAKFERVRKILEASTG